MGELVLQFIQHQEIGSLNSDERIEKLLAYVRGNKIVVLEGRLRKHEEGDLIQTTMESIDKKFKGIELAVIYPSAENTSFVQIIKHHLANMLLGERQGMTIIGPATIVREIKQDPNKIQLFTHKR
ncbi:MAG: hypothetical protein ACI8Y7_001129 [Candidatus Woesearchaeota archaeon]|jgi:hypothetical protein